MVTTLNSLPSELVASILSHLSIPSLLAFAATSRNSQVLSRSMLQTLNLVIFGQDIHCRLALISQYQESESVTDYSLGTSRFSVTKTIHSPPQTASFKRGSIPIAIIQERVLAQNRIAAEILNKKAVHDLRSLGLNMYDIRSSELTNVMATKLVKLRHLELNFHHQYIHDPILPASYWREPPDGHPCWNALAGLGAENAQALRLRNLHSLRIERAGLTSMQLRKFVEANPRLRTLRLVNVTGVDRNFVEWLAAYCKCGQGRLEHIELENCSRLSMQKLEEFAWLADITSSSVQRLSLWKCRDIRHEMLIDLIDHGEDMGLELDRLEMITPPKGPTRYWGRVQDTSSGPAGSGIEYTAEQVMGTSKIDVDPEFMACY